MAYLDQHRIAAAKKFLKLLDNSRTFDNIDDNGEFKELFDVYKYHSSRLSPYLDWSDQFIKVTEDHFSYLLKDISVPGFVFGNYSLKVVVKESTSSSSLNLPSAPTGSVLTLGSQQTIDYITRDLLAIDIEERLADSFISRQEEYLKTLIEQETANKVDKENNKGLSEENFTGSYRDSLDELILFLNDYSDPPLDEYLRIDTANEPGSWGQLKKATGKFPLNLIPINILSLRGVIEVTGGMDLDGELPDITEETNGYWYILETSDGNDANNVSLNSSIQTIKSGSKLYVSYYDGEYVVTPPTDGIEEINGYRGPIVNLNADDIEPTDVRGWLSSKQAADIYKFKDKDIADSVFSDSLVLFYDKSLDKVVGKTISSLNLESSDIFPNQSNNSGKALITDGINAAWRNINEYLQGDVDFLGSVLSGINRLNFGDTNYRISIDPNNPDSPLDISYITSEGTIFNKLQIWPGDSGISLSSGQIVNRFVSVVDLSAPSTRAVPNEKAVADIINSLNVGGIPGGNGTGEVQFNIDGVFKGSKDFTFYEGRGSVDIGERSKIPPTPVRNFSFNVGAGNQNSGSASITMGYQVHANPPESEAKGRFAVATMPNERIRSGNKKGASSEIFYSLVTSDGNFHEARLREGFLPSTHRAILPDNTTWGFKIKIMGMQRDQVAGSNRFHAELEGTIGRDTGASSVALYGDVRKQTKHKPNDNWDVKVEAATEDGSLRLYMRNAGAMECNWYARCELEKVYWDWQQDNVL